MTMTARDAPPWLGPLLVLVGPTLALMVHLHPERLRAPAWVVYAAAAAFSLCGVALVVQRWRPSARLHAWLGVAVVACLLAPVAWIALAGGDGECRVRLLGLAVPGGAWMCRAAFTVGAAMGVLILALFVRQALRTPKESR